MQNFDHNVGFREKRHFFAKNRRKSQKIVIITSTPGTRLMCFSQCFFFLNSSYAVLFLAGYVQLHILVTLFFRERRQYSDPKNRLITERSTLKRAFTLQTPQLHFLRSGTDVMIFKIFSPKSSAKKLAFLTQNKAKLCKMLIITLFFEKKRHFFAENCRKSQKIVIITSTLRRQNHVCLDIILLIHQEWKTTTTHSHTHSQK
jgi:hypothetical protein